MKRIIGIMLVVVVAATCGKDKTGPVAGELRVRLTSPNSGADSAIVLTITSPTPLTSATAGAGLRLFPQALGANTTKFALVGRLNHNATILTIGVADVGQAPFYTGTVGSVAANNYQLRTLSGYALAVVP